MKQGVLFYNHKLKRLDFEYEKGVFYGGLHCGQGFDAYLDQNPTPWGERNFKWEHVRVEYDHQNNLWYMPQHPLVDLVGVEIKMED